jgi:hypothetical protein
MKRYQVVLIAVNTALLLALLILVATLFMRHASPGSKIARKDYAPEFEEIKLMLNENSSLNHELLNRTQELSEALKSLQADAAQKDMQARVPKKYMDQIDSFFAGTEARELLSQRARDRGVWRFGKPGLLEHDLILIEYSLSNKTETLLVSIKVLDYADLEFKVIWDSFEIRP